MTGGDRNESGLQQEAARILQDINSKQSTVKPSNYKYKNHSKLFALAVGSTRYQLVLKDILQRTGSLLLNEEHIDNDVNLCVVLLYQHLVQTGSKFAPRFSKLLKKYNTQIKAAHEAFLRENNAASLTEYVCGSFRGGKDLPAAPHYARVNLIKCTVLEAVDRLCEEGWEYTGNLHAYRFKEDVSSLSERQFGVDPLLEDVLVFPFSTDLQQDRLVMEGIIVLQERASCAPAHVLNPPPGSVVLDCCAAPGNKTSHLASLMGNQGHIIAVDRDAKALGRMKSFLKKTGVTCVKSIAQNFLTMSVDSREVSDITMILLDPPSYNQGIPSSGNGEVPQKELVHKRFQIAMLRHALQFPNVKRVVYSASSFNVEEGEEVAQEVMFEFMQDFHFVPVLPEWPHSRGSESCLNHKSFLRVSPTEHLTAGTFVACFERIKKSLPSDVKNRPEYDKDISECVNENLTELHHEAAKILKYDSEGGTASSLVHSSNYKNLRQLFALVSEIIKYQPILKDILKRIGSSLLSEKQVNNDIELALVLIYEELVGAGFGAAAGVRKIMRKHKVDIKAARDEFLKDKNASSLEDVLHRKPLEMKDVPVLPRYARVNLLKSTVQDTIDRLCENGWEYVGRLHIHRFNECVMSLSERQFGLDPLLGDVLVFPFCADMDEVLLDGILISQEKASCVPVHVLNPPPDSVVLDCCAAHGNTASHLASLMGNQGRVIALESDADRVSSMDSHLQKTGATCVTTVAEDILTLLPYNENVADVTMILLDTSCSCAGHPSSADAPNLSKKDSLRILKWHYVSLLKHALRFPNVQRVVYSTCLATQLENEEVVEEVMCTVNHKFRFVPVLPAWPSSRGSKWFLNHNSFLRVSSESHLTGRLFVACFERIRKYHSHKRKYESEN